MEERQQAKIALHEAAGVVANLEKLVEESTATMRLENIVDTGLKLSGEWREFERLFKEILANVVRLRNAYLADITEIGWNSILEPERLQNDRSFDKSRRLIRQVDSLVRTYHDENIALLLGAKDSLKNLKVSRSSKNQLLSVYEQEFGRSVEAIDRAWSMELATVGEFENIINLLAARPDTWKIENGRIVFGNDTALFLYNSCLDSIDSYAVQRSDMFLDKVDAMKRDLGVR